MNQLPLHGLTVLEFSQYLSGPSAGLRLADLGARVIKIERPGTGDACRHLSIKNLWVDGDSLLFHTINRNKESFTADLKSAEGQKHIKKLIATADVLTHNFRPGVMESAGLGYEAIQKLNPCLIYGAISGYGKEGPWKDRPGQDLLLQSMSGLAYTTGNEQDNPMPFGLSIADSLCGAQLVQGILAALVRRGKTGKGALVEISMMETLLDFQFEFLTTYHSSGQLPRRSRNNNGNPLLSAPYGIYATADGHIAIAMVNIPQLAQAIESQQLATYTQEQAFSHRDEIKAILAGHLAENPTRHWLERLHAEDMWAMEVLDWQTLTAHDGYKVLAMEQPVTTTKGKRIITTRCPIRIDGEMLFSEKPAPTLGQDNIKIELELRGMDNIPSGNY
ncbi:CaiB/BaiF CoA-transferase family protein [Puia sp.]|jgi:crotonobetainyl-CoA:carnitine CoA-transferase CaiB-like acyl-CoA transferase|uniref:CaiB/BaiF CoA transferase family protein n=1 Tax=Puia sp. TaxID=2045100 RepID=UPI002F412FA6